MATQCGRMAGDHARVPVVTRVTTGRIWQHFLDEETDGAHVEGRSNTGCTEGCHLTIGDSL